MKMFNKFVVLTALSIFIYSCSSDDGSAQPTPPDNGLVTYNKHIKSVIDGSCIGCHGSPTTNGAPFSLTTYNQVKDRATSILTAISKQSGASGAMPPSGRLSQTTIDLVDQWIKDGLLEN